MSRAITVEDFLKSIESVKEKEWPIFLHNEKINGMCDNGNIVVYSYEVNNKLNNTDLDKELTVKDVYKYLKKKTLTKYIVDEENQPIRQIMIFGSSERVDLY